MHENIFNIFRTRIQHLSEFNFMDMYPESIVLNAEYACTKQPVPYKDRLTLDYKPLKEGDVWGSAWESAWVHLTGTVPESFAGYEICLRLNTSGEILIFDQEGVPACGLTERSVFDTNYCKERWNLKNVKAGDNIDIWFETAANGLGGIILPSAEEKDPKEPLGFYHPTVNALRLCTFDRQVWLFMLEMQTLSRVLDKLGLNDYKGKQLLAVLNKAVDVYAYDPANAAGAREVLKNGYFCYHAEDGALTANTIGHAHIDLGWLWPTRESTRKAARTFASQLALMDEYPDFKFGESQPYLYKEIKDNYPELFEKVKARVKEGRWELQGGMFVEADCNLISGESMVRQFLHGKNFFMDEFGVNVRNLWIPDVFGYSAAMPQIIRKSECDYFLTQKISWSQINKFPHHTFRWIGVDGSEVLTHFPPEDTYNAEPTPEQRIDAANKFNEAGILPGFMSLVGIGDGGGGPSENYVERVRIMKDLRSFPKSEWKFASDYFNEIEKYRDRLPDWKGELYLEMHRGTLTTQARTKRGNRKCEQALTALEFMESCLPADQWPREKLDKAWKTVLLNQFHDIIPGSSIREVYERTEQEHAEILKMVEFELQTVYRKLFKKNEKTAVLINTLSKEWSGIVELPANWNGCSALDEAGNEIPAQIQDGKTYLFVTVPGGAFSTITKGTKAAAAVKDTGSFVLENELMRYEFNKEGHLVSAYDKELDKEFLAGKGNVLSLYNDRPNRYEAWDIDLFYRTDKTGIVKCVEAKPVTTGAAGQTAEFRYRTEKSEIIQKVVLMPGSKRLDFITHADWHEARTMMRTAFPLDINTDKASFDIQYAYVQRPTHNNTSWDEAKFETCGQRYADVSDLNYGAALLSDCKYGYYTKGAVLDLNLLRSPKRPDRFADQGEHEFTYSFLPHSGTLIESSVMQDAANLNRSVLVADGFEAGTAAALCRMDSDGISLEVVKPAEKDSSIILRLVETKGKISKGSLRFASGPKRVSETDLVEWKQGNTIEAENGSFALVLNPFEIRTLRAEF